MIRITIKIKSKIMNRGNEPPMDADSHRSICMPGHRPSLVSPALIVSWALFFASASPNFAAMEGMEIELQKGVVVVSDDARKDNAERVAPVVLTEEVKKRTGIRWKIVENWPAKERAEIVLATRKTMAKWPVQMDAEHLAAVNALKPEGYIIFSGDPTGRPDLSNEKGKIPLRIWVIGADGRGVLFGVGKLLRLLETKKGEVRLNTPVNLVSSPAYPIRGHQLGYRNRANSWDAWTYDQFEQYIRDLIIFGTNAIEGIPFEDDSPAPLMKYPRRDMNKKIGEICDKYGIDYWVWTPVVFDLNDAEKRAKELEKHAQFYADTPTLTGVFFPGGDPGNNPARLVLPFLADIGKLLAKSHPNAKVWLSMQYFNKSDQQYVYDFLTKEKPDWFGGLVCGPSSPLIPETRAKLDPKYRLRAYPDITHTVRCQYPVPQWDRAFSLTLGRECINYRPIAYKHIHNCYAPYTDGFISYSDGVHDDLNKVIWSMAAWNSDFDIREGLIEYARYFINAERAAPLADGILALENNWKGPLAENGVIPLTLAHWQELGRELPEARKSNWRFQMALFRATYDAYQQKRLRFEGDAQHATDEILGKVQRLGASSALEQAGRILETAAIHKADDNLHQSIVALADDLFRTVQLQTAMEKYQASGTERGCSLDFMDYPLNDRFYYEDQFKRIAEMKSEEEKTSAILALANWENPGPGGLYDDVGNVGKSPHVITGEGWFTDPEMANNPNTDFTWTSNGWDRRRLAWQDWMETLGLRYAGLDSKAGYKVVATISPRSKDAKLFANGVEAEALPDPPSPPSPPVSGKFGGPIAMKAWRIPSGAITNDKLEIHFESHRADGRVYRPEIAEVWLRRE